MRFMRGRNMIPTAVIAIMLLMSVHGCSAPPDQPRPSADTIGQSSPKENSSEDSSVTMHYLEIVSNDVEVLCAAYERVHALSFGPEDPDLGMARVAARPDGSLVGVRRPLAEHEKPTMRTYLAVTDIQDAVAKAEEAGAIIAYPPTRQGERGTFAIFIHGDVEHGLWQR